jgi:Cu-processing system ATP-binding protein
MPQIGKYPYNMTVGQIFDLLVDLRDSPYKMDQDLMQYFKIQSMLHKRMGNLSGGTVQKVSAILAFLFNPGILILDEPTAGLDPISAEILKDKINAVKQEGKLVLITSHMLSELDDLVSHVVFMQDGEILFNHPTEYIKKQTGEQKISKAIAGMLKKSIYTN